jgi:hypothetical protein
MSAGSPPKQESPKGAFALREKNEFTEASGAGPLNVLTKSKYDFKKTQYPMEGLGTSVPSYVIFYVNLPIASKFAVESENLVENAFSISDQNIQKSRGRNEISTLGESAMATAAAGAMSLLGSAAGLAQEGQIGSVIDDPAKYGRNVGATAAIKTGVTGVISGLTRNMQKKPKMQRIAEAIAIYMPDTVFHTYNHDYDAQSLTAALGDMGKAQRGGAALSNAAGKLSFNPLNGFGIVDALDSLSSPDSGGGTEALGNLAEKTGVVGPGFTDFMLRNQGLALNPQVELIFKGSSNRTFNFEFKFQPKNQKETQVIKDIIFLFKRYSAPGLAGGANIPGAYFTPPGQFDIQYYFKNAENKNIGRISTCVLEGVDVNYSSSGQFATFDDGAPVEISLMLRFKEVDILTRDMIDAGF